MNLSDFESLTIKLASPEDIKGWSHGEVTKPETINYRTLKPEKDGLFCERIFGPTKDWECYCGKYKRIRYRGIICDKCGVEVTKSRVRRERMGHIDLAAPVAHVWFFKGAPSIISQLLEMKPKDLTGIIYFARYLVLKTDNDKRKEALKKLKDELKKTLNKLGTEAEKEKNRVKRESEADVRKTRRKIKSKEQQELAIEEINIKKKQKIANIVENLSSERETAEQIYKALISMVRKIEVKTVISEEEYLKLSDYRATSFVEVGMGAESLLKIIKNLDLKKVAKNIRKKVRNAKGQQYLREMKRLRVVEGMRQAQVRPEWTVVKVLPVIPPGLRPMVQLSGGRFATSDLNDLYRRVINRNNRLKHLINLGAPEIILHNEKRMLQESVDTLIDASQSGRRQTTRRASKKLRSLTDMLSGKKGRFRQNLLGKRVDYSGRSVIIVGPELGLHQCGIPKEIALEMFKPYVLHELISSGLAPNVKSAKRVLDHQPPEVFDILDRITRDHPVLLNRAPTLHRLGIQAFYPVLIEGKAIQIHPCVCAGYNADFDGDQMAVHLPLTKESIVESEQLMMADNNLLKPANGAPITVPTKEMAFGCYYLTSIDTRGDFNEKKVFSDQAEAILAYQQKDIKLRQKINVRINGKIMETTAGRIIFNNLLPKKLRFQNSSFTAKQLKSLVNNSFDQLERKEIVTLIDNLKNLGFQGATLSGLSVGAFDCNVIPEKEKIIKASNKRAAQIEENYTQGLITEEEKQRLSNELWMDTTDKIARKTWDAFDPNNSVKVIINSGGTRASKDQVKQLAAMRGLVVDPLGKIVELPTKSNFKEGLSVFEYVTSTRGSRKGLTDSAIKTADAGYLTRRLVDVAHDVIIREEDCAAKDGLKIKRGGPRGKSFFSRILGRIAGENIKDPATKKVLVKKGELINEKDLENINKSKVEEVLVRSPMTCIAEHGICQKCYGWDFGDKKLVGIGVPVGVVAAQSIGEPGTQLTMRVKHTGGIVGLDVTQGLPRVEELFEARTPKMLSPISEISGKVKIEETPSGYQITIVGTKGRVKEEKEYLVPLTSTLKVENKQLIPKGHQLASGGLNLDDILKIRGLREAQYYLIEELQRVYESQGIPINDKHFEIIVRKMCDKVRVNRPGDTTLLPGEFVEAFRFKDENKSIKKDSKQKATANKVILGITRAALYTDSWLSSASFQMTSNILTKAAVEGKKDHLIGLKENVIIGRLIPTVVKSIEENANNKSINQKGQKEKKEEN
jgi:DNA-directed RNA polymerase subunit beta'